MRATADLEPDAEQPERHEDDVGGELRAHLDADEAGEPGEQDEPAVAAAADEAPAARHHYFNLLQFGHY